MPSGHTPLSVLVTFSDTVYWFAVSLSSSWLRLISPVEGLMLKRPRRVRGRREREEGRGREGRGRVGGQKGDKEGGEEGQRDVGSKKDTTGSGHYFYATGYELSV